MNNYEKKKMELEMMKVSCAKAEMEFKILEKLEQVKILEENILVQDQRINELKERLKGE